MKHLLIMFTLLLTSVSWSEDVTDWNNIVIRNGLYFEKFSNEPYKGNLTALYKGKFKEAKKEGEWLDY